MTKFEDNLSPYLTLVESTEPSAPSAGQQRLYVDSTTHLLKITNSSGTDSNVGGGLTDPMTTRGDIIIRNASNVTARLGRGSAAQVLTSDGTDIAWAAAGGGGASTSEPYITSAPTAGLSAETVHPEFADFNASGATPVSMSGAATGTGVTVSSSADTEGFVKYTTASYQYWDVASAVGTGNFDYRCRIIDTSLLSAPIGNGSAIVYLAATDSSRTDTTAICVNFAHNLADVAGNPVFTMRNGIGQGQTNGHSMNARFPIIMRIKRVGSTVTTYVSTTEGRSWSTMGTNTNSLNVAKVGLWGFCSTITDQQVLVEWVRSY